MVNNTSSEKRCFNGILEINSPEAGQVADILMPAVIQLSYLPYRAKTFLPPQEYDQIMAELEGLLVEARHAVITDRAILREKQAALTVESTIKIYYSEPVHKHVCCRHPLSLALFNVLVDMVQLIDQWTVYAWNAEMYTKFYRAHESPFFIFIFKQKEWLKWTRQIRLEIRSRTRTLNGFPL